MIFFMKNKIRYNKRSHHFGVIKNKSKKGLTSVFMSTKSVDEGKDNIPMKKNADRKSTEPSWFIKRVRTFDKGTYGKVEKDMKLSKEDKKLSDKIYKTHLKNKKMMINRKKKNRHHS